VRRRAKALAVVAALAVTVGVWGWTRVTPPVTEAEARRYLDRIVAAAQAHDLERVCRLNGAVLNCRETLRVIGGPSTTPTTPPAVVGTRYLKKQKGGTAGMVLIVTGTDGNGKAYRSEVMVFREDRSHFKAINAVYWSGLTIGREVSPP
jgi:hypothetical protein